MSGNNLCHWFFIFVIQSPHYWKTHWKQWPSHWRTMSRAAQCATHHIWYAQSCTKSTTAIAILLACWDSSLTRLSHSIHFTHLGAKSNIRMCKDIIFWPGVQSAIRDQCNNSGICALFAPNNPKEPMLSQPVPRYLWQLVSQDLFHWHLTNFLRPLLRFYRNECAWEHPFPNSHK